MFLEMALLLSPGEPKPEPFWALSKESAQEGPGDVLLREAKGLRYAQRFFEAADRYRRYLQDQPQGPRAFEARFWLAATLEQDQRWDEASAAYTDFLLHHPEQGQLVKEAKLNRVRCWGIRQGQNTAADASLSAALSDEILEVRVAAALQLAKRGDKRAVDALQMGLSMPAYAEASSLALVQLGVKASPGNSRPDQGRFLVIRITESGKPQGVTLRLPLALARVVDTYLSDAQIQEARRKGVDLRRITEEAASLPKGSTLLRVEDDKSRVTVTVE